MRTVSTRSFALAFPFFLAACAVGSGGFTKPDGGDGGTATPDGSSPKDGSSSCKTAPPSNACGVSPQCGCEGNQTCDVTDTAGTVACVNAGSKPMGSSCSTTADCAVGLSCELGACHAFCDPNGACTSPKTNVCVNLQDGNGGDVPNLKICRMKCSLTAPAAACGTGNCIATSNGDTDCVGAGTSSTCSSSNPFACAQGTICLTDNTCHKWCQVGTTCPSGSCQALNPSVLVQGVEYGICP
jgi:hypothetical protein